MKAVRSVAAVLAGYLLFAVPAVILFHLTNRAPRQPASVAFILASTVYGVIFAGLGGFAAARIAGRAPLLHAAVLACLLGLIALVSLLAQLRSGVIWSQLTAIVFMAPAAVVGGILEKRPR